MTGTPKRATRRRRRRALLAALAAALALLAAPATALADFVPGDVDSDSVVNSRDVVMTRRHIVGGYAQSVNEPAADVNNDLAVDSADVILIRRYLAGGYDVELLRSEMPPACEHQLEATPAKSPTREAEGNIAYWHCAKCGKYFSDSAGKLEISLADTVIPMLDDEAFTIDYDVTNGDSYLAKQGLTHSNRMSYHEGDSFTLTRPTVPAGYRFLGWYDGSGADGVRVTRITASDAGDLELYAHWQLIPYDVYFESDQLVDTDSATYTVDKGLALPTPKLSNYVFVGWSDEGGSLYGKRIPVGTASDIILRANWTSERNKTYTNPNPTDPIVYEDDETNTILFTYEIGRIENVPLYTIKDFGYINEGGIEREENLTYTATTSQSTAETISNVVAKATTNSSNWTLSSGWNESTSISEEWCKANGYTREEAETIARSDSKNWNVSNSSYGSSSLTNASSSTDGWTNEVKINRRNVESDTHTDTTDWKVSGELNGGINGKTKIGANAGISIGLDKLSSVTGGVSGEREFGWNVGLKVGGEYGQSSTDTHTSTTESGFEAGGSRTHTGTSSSSATSTSGWNNSASYGGSSTTSKSNTVSTAISEQITQKTGYGKSYVKSGSESQGLASSVSDSTTDSYSSSTTYNTATSKSVTSSWSTKSTKAGYHRWIVAGTAHVFGVVGYDIDTKSFFVYTYNIMDDETHEFEDYSYTTAAYNDQENGAISFEIPYDEIMNTVCDRVFASDGLKVDLATGTITEYTGTDTLVVIPEYYNAGNGDVVRITGIAPNAFKGNTDIVTVILSDFITEIPAGAFQGCTSLAFVDGKGVTSIGDSAFAGCTSLEDCGVYSKVSNLGQNVFEGAEQLYVNAANKDVAKAAIASGANGLTLNLRFLEDREDVLGGTDLDVPATMTYFEINGNGRTFNGLGIDSASNESVINKLNVTSTTSLPIKLASSKVTLNQSSITSPGISLALTAASTDVGLRGTTTVSSTGANAMLSKNVRLYETASNVVGKLSVPQKMLVCGDVPIQGSQFLECNNVEKIDATTFNNLLNSYAVYFDPGEGTCPETSRELVYGQAIGELPVPTRDYCTFDGWYRKDTGKKVTASTVLPIGKNLTLEAKWIVSWVTDVENGWYSLQASTDGTYSLDVANSRMSNVNNGQDITLWHTNYTIAQLFKFVQNSDGTYTIWHVLGSLALGVGATNQHGHPSVVVTSNTGSNAARWYIERSDDGFYSFRNKANNLCLDVANNQMVERAAIQLHSSNGSAAQKFRMRSCRFALHDGSYSWSDAKGICDRIGGHLATITSASEETIIEGLLTKRPSHAEAYRNCYWLGGYQDGNDWKWVTGEPFTYTKWGSGQPDHDYEDKLMIFGQGDNRLFWNDIENYRTHDDVFYNHPNYGFIIEWEDDNSALQAQADEPALEVQAEDSSTAQDTSAEADKDIPEVVEKDDAEEADREDAVIGEDVDSPKADSEDAIEEAEEENSDVTPDDEDAAIESDDDTPELDTQASNPTLSMSNATAQKGATVNIPVSISNNPGIIGATLRLTYDSGLTLTNISNGEAFDALEMTAPGKKQSGCRIHWDAEDLSDANVKDGVIATLTFSVSASAGSTCSVAVSAVAESGQADVIDRALNNVTLQGASCTVTVQSGSAADGWVNLGSGKKGYRKSGNLVRGWLDLGSSKYYFGSDNAMLVGWNDVEVSGKVMHYYFNPSSGNLARGTWMTIDGQKYYFRPSGNMATGFADIDDNGVTKKYYFDESGQMLTGWQDVELNGKVMHYYFRPAGSMATGWADIDGTKYYFRASGNMATGWADVSGNKHYFDAEGRMLTGWQTISGKRYYFRASGAMQTGTATIDGKTYTFSSSGVLQEGLTTQGAEEAEEPLSVQSDDDTIDDSTDDEASDSAIEEEPAIVAA